MVRDKKLTSKNPEVVFSSDTEPAVTVLLARSEKELPSAVSMESLADFLHNFLHPYEDTLEDITKGLKYAFSSEQGQGGFVLLAMLNEQLVGALVILDTGMSGYIPEHLLLFVAVDGNMRGKGIGAHLVRIAQENCAGSIKLHVEHENPAQRLYERMGFTSKYKEMRWSDESGKH